LGCVTAGSSLHVEQDGSASRVLKLLGEPAVLGGAVLDPAALLDLDAKIEAANFPRLAPSYMCMSDECPLIGSVVFNVTVQLDGRPYSVAVDAYFMEQHPDQVPRPLIEATQAIEDIFNHAAWR